MNIFRIAGDMSHLASFVFLLQRLLEKRSAAGISLKTLELYLLVFVTRYLDIFHNLFSLLVDYHGIIAYNSVMKIIYIAVSAYVVYLLRKVDPWRASYRAEAANDSFLHWKMAVLPCVALAIFFNEGNWTHWRGVIHYVAEVAWAFSIYLEAVAIAPQLILLQRHRHVENITSYYVACLGAYRWVDGSLRRCE